MAKSLSISDLAKDYPYGFGKDDFAAYLANGVIDRYMFVYSDNSSERRIWDSVLMDDLLTFIYNNSELNFCLNLLGFSSVFLKGDSYDGRRVLTILINRFRELQLEEHLLYSKLMLNTVYEYWNWADNDSFNEFANIFFQS
ncbi:MAG: hypothetical protein IK103_08950 [Bacteroidales bacterium]|nr:hypothetical protein [Bacteroidales bacterium]